MSYVAEHARHGTLTGYTYWGCRCDACRAANSAYQADLRLRYQAKLAAPETVVEHGLVSTYTNHGCRCDSCREAQRAQAAAYRAGRTA